MPVILGVFGVVLVYILGESAVKKLKSCKTSVDLDIKDTDSERVVINLEKTDDVKEEIKLGDSIPMDTKKKKKKSTGELMKKDTVNEFVDELIVESASLTTEAVLEGVAKSTVNTANRSKGSSWDCDLPDCDCGPDCDCS